MNIFQMLGQALGGAKTASPDQQVFEDIVVEARKPVDRSKTMQPDIFEADPLPVLVRREASKMGKEERGKSRASPLGVRGKARDILGGVGDALLIGNGEKPTYAPKRRAERISDAMEIYRQNPEAGMKVLTDVDPEYARQFQMDNLDMGTKRLTAEGNLAYKDGMLENAAVLRQQRAADLLGRFGANLNEQNWPQLSKVLYERAVKGGFEGLIPPPGEKFDPKWAQQISNVGSSAYNQQRLDQIGENQSTNAALRGESNEIARLRTQNSRIMTNIAQERQRIQEERLLFERERENWRRQNPYPKAGSKRRTGQGNVRTVPNAAKIPGAVPID